MFYIIKLTAMWSHLAPLLFIIILSLCRVKADSNLLLDHKGLNADEGTKHLDLHDKEDLALHAANTLANKGTDKSTTQTTAVLTATMNAKDKHEDSYSHLHDNAHETDFGADQDMLLGNEAIAGHENDDEGVDYIDPGTYAHYEHPHDEHTMEYEGYPAEYMYDEYHPGHVLHSPMVHAGVHGSVHPSVHGHHMPIGSHHQHFADGGFVPNMHHDMHYMPDHGFVAPDHGMVHPSVVPHAVHPRRRYFVSAPQTREVAFVPHSEFNDDVHGMPWVAGDFH